jgi:hypothetical protein
MDYSDIRQVIETHFQSNWTDPSPIAWDNAPFETPKDASWVRLTIAYSDAQNASLGKLGVHIPGIIGVQVFTLADGGTGDAYRLADLIKGVLQNKTLVGTTGKIFTYATSVQVIGDAIRKINKIEYGEYQIVCKTRFVAH